MDPPDPVLEQLSPLGNVSAVVEDDGRVVFLYLRFENPPEGTAPIRACWLRNRIAAPAAAMQKLTWLMGDLPGEQLV